MLVDGGFDGSCLILLLITVLLAVVLLVVILLLVIIPSVRLLLIVRFLVLMIVSRERLIRFKTSISANKQIRCFCKEEDIYIQGCRCFSFRRATFVLDLSIVGYVPVSTRCVARGKDVLWATLASVALRDVKMISWKHKL